MRMNCDSLSYPRRLLPKLPHTCCMKKGNHVTAVSDNSRKLACRTVCYSIFFLGESLGFRLPVCREQVSYFVVRELGWRIGKSLRLTFFAA